MKRFCLFVTLLYGMLVPIQLLSGHGSLAAFDLLIFLLFGRMWWTWERWH